MTQHAFSRRLFLGSAVGGLAGATLSTTSGQDIAASKADVFHEAARDVPLNKDADVIVCGAGPAGVTAAIAAARNGARVRLFEAHGCLGGVWTSGLLGYLLDFDKPGFNQELVGILRERDALHGDRPSGMCYQPEEMKLVLEELCQDAGVQVQMHTRVAAAYGKDGRLQTILTESKSGREAWQAPIFIDTTGDGDLGALAGCEFEIGESKDCPCQPMSMDALLVVEDADQLRPFIHGTDVNSKPGQAKKNFLAEIRRAGHDPSYRQPTLFPIRDNLLLAMMNHEYGIMPYDARGVSDATIRARAELHTIVRALRKLGGPWKGLQIVATPEQIGIRDGRRIRGRYVVTQDDVANGARHDDAVVRATFAVDVHATKLADPAYSNRGIKTKPYDIPIRALIARDVDGLLLAGRCISGDFIAHSSYRVTGNSVAMGEAAGSVGALSALTKRLPQDVPWNESQVAIEKSRRVT
ncbi:MAG TPA: FAD-dependent oxidoreductase [Planctomicrobium sp.]|nr:FAD-dependent oxidoreductase [Planctomicrobium sp.]